MNLPPSLPMAPCCAAILSANTARAKSDDENGKTDDDKKPSVLLIHCKDPRAAEKAFADKLALAEGVFVARDLINEPANALGPVEFADRAGELAALGVEVEILEPEALEKLGMGALLGVAQGSVRPARVVVMQWHGAKSKRSQARLHHRQGRRVRQRRPLDEARRRHGRHEGRHGRSRLRRRVDARARRAQSGGECRRHHRHRREHGVGRRPAPRRHRHVDVRPDHRSAQHRRRRPPRAGGYHVVRAGPLQAAPDGRSRDAHRRHHGRARQGIRRPLLQRRQARRRSRRRGPRDRREGVADAAPQGLRQDARQSATPT